jgi:hypothetical protein
MNKSIRAALIVVGSVSWGLIVIAINTARDQERYLRTTMAVQRQHLSREQIVKCKGGTCFFPDGMFVVGFNGKFQTIARCHGTLSMCEPPQPFEMEISDVPQFAGQVIY